MCLNANHGICCFSWWLQWKKILFSGSILSPEVWYFCLMCWVKKSMQMKRQIISVSENCKYFILNFKAISYHSCLKLVFQHCNCSTQLKAFSYIMFYHLSGKIRIYLIIWKYQNRNSVMRQFLPLCSNQKTNILGRISLASYLNIVVKRMLSLLVPLFLLYCFW